MLQDKIPPDDVPPDKTCAGGTHFQSARLIFREWTARDLDALHGICSDPDVMRYVAEGQPWSHEATEQFISQAVEMQAARGYCQWALIRRDEFRLIGFCGFVPAAEGLEVGWRLSRQDWGQGLATEAARRVIEYGFESLVAERITATVQEANQASLRVAEKLGMTRESRCERNGRKLIVLAIAR